MADRWLMAVKKNLPVFPVMPEETAPVQCDGQDVVPDPCRALDDGPVLTSRTGQLSTEDIASDNGELHLAAGKIDVTVVQLSLQLDALTASLDLARTQLDLPAVITIFDRLRTDKDLIADMARRPQARSTLDRFARAYIALIVEVSRALQQEAIDFSSLSLHDRQVLCNGMGAILYRSHQPLITVTPDLRAACADMTEHLLGGLASQGGLTAGSKANHALNLLNWLTRGLRAKLFDSSLAGLRDVFVQALVAMPAWVDGNEPGRQLTRRQFAKCFTQLVTMARPDMLPLGGSVGKAMAMAFQALASSPVLDQTALQGDPVQLANIAEGLRTFISLELLDVQGQAVEQVATAVLRGFLRTRSSDYPGTNLALLVHIAALVVTLASVQRRDLANFAKAVELLAQHALAASRQPDASTSARVCHHLLDQLVDLHKQALPGRLLEQTIRLAVPGLIESLVSRLPDDTLALQAVAGLLFDLDYFSRMAFHLPAAGSLCNALAGVLQTHAGDGSLDALRLHHKSRLMRYLAHALDRYGDNFAPAEKLQATQALVQLAASLDGHVAAEFSARDRVDALESLHFLFSSGASEAETHADVLYMLLGSGISLAAQPLLVTMAGAIDILRFGSQAARHLRPRPAAVVRARSGSLLNDVPVPVPLTRGGKTVHEPPENAATRPQDILGATAPVLKAKGRDGRSPAAVAGGGLDRQPVHTAGATVGPRSGSGADTGKHVHAHPETAATATDAQSGVPAITARRRRRRNQGSSQATVEQATSAKAAPAVRNPAPDSVPVGATPLLPPSPQSIFVARPASRQQRREWETMLARAGKPEQLKKLLAAHPDLLDVQHGAQAPALCLAIQGGTIASVKWLLGLAPARAQFDAWAASEGRFEKFLQDLDLFDDALMARFEALLGSLRQTAAEHSVLFDSIDTVVLRSMPSVRELMVRHKLIAPFGSSSTAVWPITERPERHLSDHALRQRMFVPSRLAAVRNFKLAILWNEGMAGEWNSVFVPEPVRLAVDDDAAWGGGKEQFLAALEELKRRSPGELDFTDEGGNTPLLHALVNCQYQAVHALLAAGAHTDVVRPNGTALTSAVQSGSIEMVAALLQHGASINLAALDGATVLMAMFVEPLEMADYLIRAGAELNVMTDNGGSPLQIAVSLHNLPLAALMLENGAQPDLSGTDGFTPLINAASRGAAGLVALLARHGARVDQLFRHGEATRSAVEIALAGYEELLAGASEHSRERLVTDRSGYVVDYPGVLRVLLNAGVPFDPSRTSNARFLEMIESTGDDELLNLLSNAQPDVKTIANQPGSS